MSWYGRPPFDVKARVVARREMPIGETVYAPGEELAEADRATFTDRQLATLWQLGQIDTPSRTAEEPDEAELERLTAPQRSQAKPASDRR